MLNIVLKNEVEEQTKLINGKAPTGMDKEMLINLKIHEYHAKQRSMVDIFEIESPNNDRVNEINELNDKKPGVKRRALSQRKLGLDTQFMAQTVLSPLLLIENWTFAIA